MIDKLDGTLERGYLRSADLLPADLNRAPDAPIATGRGAGVVL
jgi:hypothetical protein